MSHLLSLPLDAGTLHSVTLFLLTIEHFGLTFLTTLLLVIPRHRLSDQKLGVFSAMTPE